MNQGRKQCDFCAKWFNLYYTNRDLHYRTIDGSLYKFCRPEKGERMSRCEKKHRAFLRKLNKLTDENTQELTYPKKIIMEDKSYV